MFNGRLDDKGRMKLAAALVQYFGSLPEKKLFVTSLDRHTAQIYPISVWRSNEQLFEEHREDSQIVRKISFNAADLGSETEVDSQGRLLFSPTCGACWASRTRPCTSTSAGNISRS